MAQRTQFIRHAKAQADTFQGLEGEITVDLTGEELRVHNGVASGGRPVARADLTNAPVASNSQDGKMAASRMVELESATSNTAANTNKLLGIEAGATKDQTKSDIDGLGINASQVAGFVPKKQESGSYTFPAVSPGDTPLSVEIAHALGTDDIAFSATTRAGTFNGGAASWAILAVMMRPDGGVSHHGFIDTTAAPPLVFAPPVTGKFALRIKNNSTTIQACIVDYVLTVR